MRTYIIFWMSSNFNQIGPPTKKSLYIYNGSQVVLTCTHDLCLRANNCKKIMYTPESPQFFDKKVGCMGVQIIWGMSSWWLAVFWTLKDLIFSSQIKMKDQFRPFKVDIFALVSTLFYYFTPISPSRRYTSHFNKNVTLPFSVKIICQER